jgi:large subunit ribosomal protein L24e
LYQRKKPAKLAWTQAWRRLHKKTAGLDTTAKKRNRKAAKVQRAIVGASLDDIKKKANQKAEFRSAQRDAALKEAKAAKKVAGGAKKTGGKGTFAHLNKGAQKHGGGKGSRGGAGSTQR